jgi:2-acylglycerol O-acyltransferase 2
MSNPAKKKRLYGFGAAANVVGSLPFLRNLMGWLSAGPADYRTLKDGLVSGISKAVNRAGRRPRHLYLLPGGIAEVFVSTPGKNSVVFKDRKGLCKLSLETGAKLLPCYVFGGTDFFHNLATGDGLLSKLSRKFRITFTIFWGYGYLPLPYCPRVTICIAEPIHIEKWAGPGPVPETLVEDLHRKYLLSLTELFDKYKSAAGYPDSVLEIR